MEELTPEMLLRGYAMGIFPMADSAQSETVAWYEPRLRGILPLHSFHTSKNVLRRMRNTAYQIRINHSFDQVMAACAARNSTWINPLIVAAYAGLHAQGHAHSVEVWLRGALVGGLYGVTLGGAFFGESMFHTTPDADKVALHHCHQRLVQRGFVLWDAQFYTEHLGSFGCIELPQAEYLLLLEEALAVQAHFV